MSQAHALIVDDEADIRELLEITLGRMNVATHPAADLEQARAALAQRTFDLCITDMRLPDGSGIDLIREIQEQHPNTPVAMITAYGNAQAAVESLKAGAFDFVSKPVDLEILRKLVNTALQLRPEAQAPTGPDSQLLGNSKQIQELRALVQRLARSQAPVHIFGESGTGKELVARMIHSLGPRAQAAFVPVNCGAIPGELMESEFFGHIKGSFTGATRDKEGLFQAAEGGTLFLDEVADLPLHMQVKLLRAVQERAVRPVGGQREVPVNVRIVSATHKNLHEQVAIGEFRQDLYYRLNVIEVQVPPLRERGEDITSLAQEILQRLLHEQGRTDRIQISDAAFSALEHYSFPGNVRELENILERAVALCDSQQITIDDLQLRDTDIRDHAPANTELRDEGSPLPQQLEDAERQAIIEALKKSRYNKTKAAELLGMSFRSLRYRIKKLKID